MGCKQENSQSKINCYVYITCLTLTPLLNKPNGIVSHVLFLILKLTTCKFVDGSTLRERLYLGNLTRQAAEKIKL